MVPFSRSPPVEASFDGGEPNVPVSMADFGLHASFA